MSIQKKSVLFLAGMAILFGLLYGTGAFFAEGPVGKGGFAQNPGLSEDGEKLAFVHYEKGTSSLYIVDAEGGEARPLLHANEGREYKSPVFSPDGSKIAYLKTWRNEGIPYSQLMMYDLEKEKGYPVQSADSYIKEAVFAPSGTSLFVNEAAAYDEQPQGDGFFAKDYDIHRLTLESEEKEKFTSLNMLSMSLQDVFPEGDRLLYTYFDNRDHMRVFDRRKDTYETLRTEASYDSGAMNGPSYGAPAISPDGSRVAFSDVTRTHEGVYEYEIVTMTTDGTDVEQVTEFYEMATDPIYFPEGDRLLVTVDQNFAGEYEENEYWIVDVEGNKREKVDIVIPGEG